METATVKVDLHRAVCELRSRFFRCEKILREAGQQDQMEAMRLIQSMAESLTQKQLGIASIQDTICYLLGRVEKSRIDGMYHNAFMIFCYSAGVNIKGELSAKLFEKF